MNFVLLLCLLGAFICHVNQAAVVDPQGCVYDEKVYSEGQKWTEKCASRCECAKDDEGFHPECVSLCPPAEREGCTKKYKTTRDEELSIDCCPVLECPGDCKNNGHVMHSGDMEIFGDELCGCFDGVLECFLNPFTI